MMKISPFKIVVLALLIYGALPKLSAQVMPSSFDADNVKFIQEMRDFFESYDKKDGKNFIDDFNEQYWQNNKLSDDLKQMMYRNCNMMVTRKFRPAPEYYSYINAMKAIVDKNISMSTVSDWQTCFMNIGKGKLNKPFSDFIQMSESLFSENKFFKTTSGYWYSAGGSWQFACDSVPSIRYTNVTLTGVEKNDSTKIVGTSGVFYPSKGTWTGKGGRVNFTRAGLKDDEAYADLKTYSITLKSFSYVADSVTFFNKAYFRDKPLLGRLDEKLIVDVTVKSANFPRFASYSSRYQLKAIYPNVDYEGGFTQIGAKFIGSGSQEGPAYFVFKRNGKDFLFVSARSFIITKDKVTSEDAYIRFTFDQDSVVHPDINFKYFVDSSRVVLYRPNEGASQAPFYDSFHKVNMYIQELEWKTNEPLMTIGTLLGSTQAEASFPSINYFRQYLYDQLQGLEMVHPLIRIRNFMRDVNKGGKTFTLQQLAAYWKISSDELRPMIASLAYQGFLIYNPNGDMITYLDKIDFYIAARAGKMDYDNIQFDSKVTPGTPNAKINLLNYDLTIFGVDEVALSDSQNVTVFPNEDMIVVKKNRNFTFEGSIMAGRFDYYGKLFSFDYSTFKLALTNVDSVRIWVDTPQRDPQDPKGGFIQMKVKSVIENLNGTLSIDSSINKSGIKNDGTYARYPIFTSAKPAFVYYDKPGIQKGVYKRDNFYFKLDPFTIDSLDNFTNKSLRFGGVFASAGIFPDIRDTLRLMPDYSLGFVRKSPPGGYSAYGGKAKFTNKIILSNKGLHGDGKIDYITSTSVSKDFLFFPDSTNGIADTFNINEQKISGKTEYPDVQGSGAYVHWMPKSDYMNVTSRDSSFHMYAQKSKFKGTLTLSPKTLNGNGTLMFSSADMKSKKMVFKQHIVDADTADFSLKALEMAGLAFSTNDVNAHLDFEKKEGDFRANGKAQPVNFPVNQYMAYMENFKWFMDRSEIELNGGQPKQGAPIDLTGPRFVSTNPKQDSLSFNAPKAKFDLRNYIIRAEGVQKILVADAIIVPDSGKVVIRRDAYMDPLENSKITANSITMYHKLFNCHTEISSRHSYLASGDYAYVDELKKEQIIHFAKVTPDTAGQTYAEGTIADSSKFMLSPAFDFRGKVILAANNNFLVFDGSTQLQHDCSIGKTRLAFKGEINPDQIYIPVTGTPVDDKGKPVSSGIMSTVSADSIHLYGTFLSPVLGKTDVNVITADGFLFFDKLSREYRISNKEKLVEQSLPGNYISLSTKTCSIYGEGKMMLGADLGKVFIQPIGNATHNATDHSTSFDLVLGIDFFMSDKAMDVLVDDINASTSLAGTDPSRQTFQRALNEMVGKEKADKLISQLSLYQQYKKFPDELKFTMFFTDVKMNWNQKTKSYISDGKLGLGSIGKTQLNKYIPGTIMLERKKSGDVLTIYFELDNSKWYIFNYSNNMMTVFSSNQKFCDIITGLKDDDKSAPDDYDKDRFGDKKTPHYKFTLGSPAVRDVFLKKLKRSGAGDSGGSDPDNQGN